MRQFIKDTLVQMHRTASTDKYGQLAKHNFTPSLFGDRSEEVEQYCQDNKGILRYSTYGASYGTYRAFTIEDSEIRLACSRALSNNHNHIRNINSW